jgi:pimeloyl-ACP methyl ester carboxylesterase
MKDKIGHIIFRKTTCHILILLVSITLYSCKTTPTELKQDQNKGVKLSEFSCNFLEISGVAPTGWVEVYPGAFKRSEHEKDFTTLIQRSYPQINNNLLLESTHLMKLTSKDSLPNPLLNLKTDFLQWNLYRLSTRIDSVTMVLNLALAEDGTKSFIVILLTPPSDQDYLYESVYLPAIKAFKPMDDTSSNKIREDNLHLFTYDKTQPLNIQEMQRSVNNNITEIEITYASPKGGKVPATLLIPDGKGPFPGIVFMHGLPGNRHRMKNLAVKYAYKNVVCIMIDAPWARSSQLSVGFNLQGAGNVTSDRDFPLTFTVTDKDEQIQLITDLCRAVDLLEQRPDVDSEQLAYIGISYGGAMGGLFAGIENRLKAYVLEVGDGGLVNHFFGMDDLVFAAEKFNKSAINKQWFDDMWPIEPLHYVGNAAPAALLFQNGKSDLLVPAHDAIRYQLAGSSPKEIMWYESGHSLNDQALKDQFKWLGQYINLKE